MPWSPPNSAPGMSAAAAEAVIAAAEETGGAAYRVNKAAWAAQQDAQIPYWAGFTRTYQGFGQDTVVEATVGGKDSVQPRYATDKGVVNREMRQRSSKSDAPDSSRGEPRTPTLVPSNVPNEAPPGQFFSGIRQPR